MFKKSLFIFLFSLCTTLSVHAETDTNMNMNPPKPLQNSVYDAMVGEWHGDSNMMGMKMHDTVKIRWGINHQFLIMEVTSTSIDKSKPKMKYEGIGIFGVDSQGKAKTWWFDSWGAESMSTGTGNFTDNKLDLKGANSMMSEERSFEIKGKQMIMYAKGTMTWEGKTTPFEDTTIYKKK